ncbi:MAG: DUF1961 family protein [Clostridia bacterium]|nr:DUF1961 family protein [Clostridia bacterium]
MQINNSPYSQGKLIYENPLASARDLADFTLEGKAKLSFPEGKLQLENAENASLGQKANYVLWCRQEFPADFLWQMSFRPLREPGLAMLFFAAAGRNGQDLFDPGLSPRTGEYPQYHHGDINAFHLSFFRRKEPDERGFHTCNLRKSYGFYLTAQGADPIPDVADAMEPYLLSLWKKGPEIRFAVNDLEVLRFLDDGSTWGPLLGGGKMGLRQLAPMIGEYANWRVYELPGAAD